MRKLTSIIIMFMTFNVMAGDGSFPTDPKVNECYFHEFTPPTYEQVPTAYVQKQAWQESLPVWNKYSENIETYAGDVWALDCLAGISESACFTSEYSSVSVTRDEVSYNTIDHDAVMGTVMVDRVVDAGSIVWVPVACDVITTLQTLLIANGYVLLEVDGIIGMKTTKALYDYKKKYNIKSKGVNAALLTRLRETAKL